MWERFNVSNCKSSQRSDPLIWDKVWPTIKCLNKNSKERTPLCRSLWDINCYCAAVCNVLIIFSHSFLADNVRNLTHWFDTVFDKVYVIILHRIKGDWIMIIIMFKSLHSCQHVNECSGLCMLSEWITLSSYAQFLAPKHTLSICCSLSVSLFSLDVCFQTEMIQSGATESLDVPELLPERLKRERLYLLRDLHLCKPTALDVLIQRLQKYYTHVCCMCSCVAFWVSVSEEKQKEKDVCFEIKVKVFQFYSVSSTNVCTSSSI